MRRPLVLLAILALEVLAPRAKRILIEDPSGQGNEADEIDITRMADVRRQKILSGVGQTFCWAASRRWDDLPAETRGVVCGPDLPGFAARIGRDDLAFITHSLGSRATLDALQRLVTLPAIIEPPQARRMVARGAGHPNVAPLVAERCSFREVDETLAR